MGENIRQQNLNDKFICLVADVISVALTVILFCKGLLVRKNLKKRCTNILRGRLLARLVEWKCDGRPVIYNL